MGKKTFWSKVVAVACAALLFDLVLRTFPVFWGPLTFLGVQNEYFQDTYMFIVHWIYFVSYGLRVWLLFIVGGVLWRIYFNWVLRLPRRTSKDSTVDAWFKLATPSSS